MSNPSSHSEPPRHVPTDAAVDEWARRVHDARQRLTVGARGADDRSPLRREGSAFLSELALVFEEMQVAEEELHVQTEQLSVSRSLLESERAHYQSLFESAPIPYLLTDSRGVIREANGAAAALFQIPSDRLSGKPLVVYLDPKSRRAFRDQVSALLTSSAATATLRLHMRTRQGRRRFLHATIGGVRDRRGTLLDLRWLLVDETSRRRRERRARSRPAELEILVEQRTAELRRAIEVQTELATEAQLARDQAESASREKSELIAIVSHELRTPLAAIGGYAELLALGARGALNEAQHADTLRIQEAQAHILRLVDDLLGYAKLGAGRLRFDVVDVIVADAIQDIVALVRPQAARKRIDIALEPPHENVVIRADEERLRQIVLNLLSNAIKFTLAGGHVTISWTASDTDVQLVIRDTGAGIPVDKLETIFEPYVQLDAPHDARANGWGLGLAISRDMARAMSGDLSATSTPGQGAIFGLRLPRSTRLASSGSRC